MTALINASEVSNSILSQGKGERRGKLITPYTRSRAHSRDMWTRQRTPPPQKKKKQSRCRETERQKIIDRERIILAGPSTLFFLGFWRVKCSGGEEK